MREEKDQKLITTNKSKRGTKEDDGRTDRNLARRTRLEYCDDHGKQKDDGVPRHGHRARQRQAEFCGICVTAESILIGLLQEHEKMMEIISVLYAFLQISGKALGSGRVARGPEQHY